MGYVHDTAMAQWVTPAEVQYSAGTWTDVAAGNLWSKNRAAADAAFTIRIPICPPQNGVPSKGSRVTSVEVYYEVTTAAMDSVTASPYKSVAPSNGAAWPAVSSPGAAFDTANTVAANRASVDEHKLIINFTTPIFLDDDEVLGVELACDAAATSVFKFYGAKINYTLRV